MIHCFFAGLVAGSIASVSGQAPPSSPAPLAITGATTVAPYTLIRLNLTGGAVDDAEWEAVYAQDVSLTVDGLETDAKGAGYVFVGPPGTYRVSAWAVRASRITRASIVVVIQGLAPPGPTPPSPTPPNPNPPNPTPQPVIGKLWAVAVFDADQLSSLPMDQRELRVAPTLRDSLAAQQTIWRAYDLRSSAIATGPWKSVLAETGLPGLVILDEAGIIRWHGPLPADAGGVLAVVSKLRGK